MKIAAVCLTPATTTQVPKPNVEKKANGGLKAEKQDRKKALQREELQAQMRFPLI